MACVPDLAAQIRMCFRGAGDHSGLRDGLSQASHMLRKEDLGECYPRSERVRRQGLEPQVRTGAPPGTRTPNPRIKSPLLSSILLFHLVSYGIVQCRDVPFRAGRRTAALSARTGSCRGVPGLPSKHGANMGTGRSRPLRKMITTFDGRTAPSGPEFWHGNPLLC